MQRVLLKKRRHIFQESISIDKTCDRDIYVMTRTGLVRIYMGEMERQFDNCWILARQNGISILCYFSRCLWPHELPSHVDSGARLFPSLSRECQGSTECPRNSEPTY
jgi:hypothetical protein